MEITVPYDFTPRHYQEEPWNAFLNPEFQRGILVVPRRNGKDLLCWNALIAKAVQRPGLYYYMAPFYNQVRQIIWEGFDGSGRRFVDYIPPQLITGKTKIDMRIDLTIPGVGQSQIKLQGSDNIDRIVGTNPVGIVFTEFSLHKPQAWEYLRPILAENGGWAIFNGTPRGLNHFYDLYNAATKDPKWYTQYLTRDNTGVPTLEAIEDDRKSGMPDELIKQEYYCSFLSGVRGSYYADILEDIRSNGQVTKVPYDPRIPVYTAWDIGVNDSNAIWFAQLIGQDIRLIDYYENNGLGLTHYIKYCRNKPYVYEEHFGPEDFNVFEYALGMTRIEKAAELGFDIVATPKQPLVESHDAVRDMLTRCYFDANKCFDGVNALMSYQKQYNEVTQQYSDTPLRNWAKHGADAFKTLIHNVDELQQLAVDRAHHRWRKGGSRVKRAYNPQDLWRRAS